MNEFVFLFRSSVADRPEARANADAVQSSIQKWLAWVTELDTKGLLKDGGQPFDSGGCVVKGSKTDDYWRAVYRMQRGDFGVTGLPDLDGSARSLALSCALALSRDRSRLGREADSLCGARIR